MSEKPILVLLNRLKQWLLAGEKKRSNREYYNVFLPAAEAAGGDEEFDYAIRLELLSVFTGVLNNHPERKDQFFEVIQKMMETNDPRKLSKDERRFMLEILEEAIFSVDTDAPHGEA